MDRLHIVLWVGLNGNSRHEIYMEPHDTVSMLQRKVKKVTGLRRQQQKLLLLGEDRTIDKKVLRENEDSAWYEEVPLYELFHARLGGLIEVQVIKRTAEVLEVLGSRFWDFNSLSEEMQGDLDIVIEAVYRSPEVLQNVRAEFRDNERVVRQAAEAGVGTKAAKYASERLRADRSFMKFLVCQDYRALKYASSELRDDPSIVRAAVRRCGLCLKYASRRLQGDPELVSLALSSWPSVLELLSEELRDNEQFVRIAIQEAPSTLRFASARLRDDPDLVTFAVTREVGANQGHWTCFSFASERLRGDQAFVMSVVELSGRNLEHASAQLRDDAETVLAALRQDTYALQHASERLRADRGFILTAMNIDVRVLQYADPQLQDDDAVAGMAVAKDDYAFKHISFRLKHDPRFNAGFQRARKIHASAWRQDEQWEAYRSWADEYQCDNRFSRQSSPCAE